MLNSMLGLCKIYCIYRCSLEKKVAFPSHKCCAVLWGNASTIKGGLVFLAAQISLHLQPPTHTVFDWNNLSSWLMMSWVDKIFSSLCDASNYQTDPNCNQPKRRNQTDMTSTSAHVAIQPSRLRFWFPLNMDIARWPVNISLRWRGRSFRSLVELDPVGSVIIIIIQGSR